MTITAHDSLMILRNHFTMPKHTPYVHQNAAT